MFALGSLSFGVGSAAAILNIWFVCWAIRRQGELDYELDLIARVVRWVVVALCLGLVFEFPQLFNPPTLRVCVAFFGIAFLAWPNLAYHTTRFLRFIKFIRKPNPTI
jgi:hypothetical protein